MARTGKFLLVTSLFVVAVAVAQVSQKPFPGLDLNNHWTGVNDFTQPIASSVTGNAATATNMAYSGLTGFPSACGANQFSTQIAATPGCTQPSFSNISGTVGAGQFASGTVAVADVIPGTNGQCVNTAGGATVWGSCAGTAGEQLLSVNTTPVTANANTSSAQTMQQAATAISAGALNTLKKTIRVTASGTFTAVNTTESIQLSFSPCAACSLSALQPPFIANTAAAAYNWTTVFTCSVTVTGATGTLVCAASGNIGGSVSTQNTLAQAAILTYTNVDLTGAMTPQNDISFTTASASNSGTSSYFLVEQLN